MTNVSPETSDGYHTFAELYEHRHVLFGVIVALTGGWKSQLHSDGTSFDGWFIAGTKGHKELQVTYHLPMSLWDSFPGEVLPRAPVWDGHTSADVVERMRGLWTEIGQRRDVAEFNSQLRVLKRLREEF